MPEDVGPEEIVRVAARGDGVTATGRHIAGAAPADSVDEAGRITQGPHHATPPCRHFGACGGCALQHLDEATLAQFVHDRVVGAAAGQGLVAERIAPVHLSPPGARRRAGLAALGAGGKVQIGFREERSHRVVDLAECPVLAPPLAALIAPLRAALKQGGGRIAAGIELMLADQGVDCGLKGVPLEGLVATERWLDFARDHGLARLTFDHGYGPEPLWEPEPVSITLGGVAVPLPPGSFLQATADGEAALAAAAGEWLAGTGAVADLFAGLGTFAFALANAGAKVLAAEASREAHLACKAAAGRARLPVHALHRDLYRNPLLPDELARFGAVLLDPPRAGAREQIERIAASAVSRVVYVSCNPASWARDAARLAAAGFRLAELRPVGQFRWSTHVELASLLVR